MKFNRGLSMSLISLSFIMICGILIVNCSDDDIVSSPEVTRYILPLKVGNQWWGTLMNYDSAGTPTDTIPIVYRIIGDTVFQNETWYKWELEYNGSILTDSTNSPLMTNRNDGVYQWIKDSSDASIWYQYPAAVADTFMSLYLKPDSASKATVISIDTAINVPSGEYVCYHYNIENTYNIFDAEMLLAPNIGFVRWESNNDTTSAGQKFMTERYELDSLFLH